MNTIHARLHTDRNLLLPTAGRVAADGIADLLEPLIQGALMLSLVGALLVSGYAVAAPAAAPATATNNGDAVAECTVPHAPARATQSL